MFKTSIFIVISLCLCVISENNTKCIEKCNCKYIEEINKDFLTLKVDCSHTFIDISFQESPVSTQILDLSRNNITLITKSKLLQSNTIEVLYLNKNFINEVAIGALNLPELEKLDLSSNWLEFLDPEVFKYTKKLAYLNLAGNRFTDFPPLMFHHLLNLKFLNLDNNNVGKQLKEINIFQRSNLALSTAITNLSLANISLNIIPENMFSDAYDLRQLILSSNNISSIPELPFTLEYLDLSDNPIEHLYPIDFSDLPALKVLLLNNILMDAIEDNVFVDLHNLRRLELERNANLKSFSPLAFGQEVLDDSDEFLLEVLSFRDSRLSQLSEELLEPFGRLSKLDLQGNPWQCDCKLAWLKQLQILPEDYQYARCASPRSVLNAKLFNLKSKYFRCQKNQNGAIAMTLAVTSLCLLLAGVGLWIYFCVPRHHLTKEYARNMYSLLPLERSL